MVASPFNLGPLQIRHCERCNHVFVYGMQRFREHSLTCGGAANRLESEVVNRLDPVNRPQEPVPVAGVRPSAPGPIQQQGIKRHADEGGQRNHARKGRSGSGTVPNSTIHGKIGIFLVSLHECRKYNPSGIERRPGPQFNHFPKIFPKSFPKFFPNS